MARETETTKRAAVWNPPRLNWLGVGGVKSGSISGGTTYEGSQREVGCPNDSPSTGYRMPTSSEPVLCPYPWQ